jgi:hypothetical protein
MESATGLVIADVVAAKAFDLHYQPIVDAATGAL